MACRRIERLTEGFRVLSGQRLLRRASAGSFSPRPLAGVGLFLACSSLALLLAGSRDGWSQDAAQDLAARAPAADVESPAEQIEAWVKQLNDDRFVVRRSATDRLILAGEEAVQPIADAVAGGNLEVRTRGIYVLRELALSMDVAAQVASLEALQQLSQSPRRSAARLAQAAIDEMGDVRQERAIRQLEQLGAKITTLNRSNGLQLVRHIVVEIGPDWEGTLEDLQRLKWMRDVRKIAFTGERFTDPWIEPAANLAGLEHLVIKRANISDKALAALSQLKRVIQVDLMYTPVTDASLQHLKGLKSLRLVRCYGTQITKAAAARFQAELANVELDHKLGAFLGVGCQQASWPCVVTQVRPESAALRGGIRVRDIIVRYDGKPVASFDDLRQLIAGNRVGDSVVIVVARGGQPLSSTVPRLSGQGLGLEGESTAYGCRVTKVKANGVAAKAGIRATDLIVGMDDERVFSVEQLQELYAKSVERKVADVQLLRGAKIHSAEVTFGEWNEQ